MHLTRGKGGWDGDSDTGQEILGSKSSGVGLVVCVVDLTVDVKEDFGSTARGQRCLLAACHLCYRRAGRKHGDKVYGLRVKGDVETKRSTPRQ